MKLGKQVIKLCERVNIETLSDSDKEKEIYDLVDSMIQTLLKDGASAEIQTGLNRDSERGDVTHRYYSNSYPKWYKNIGVKNQDDLKKIVRTKKGIAYKRLVDTAKDILVNGYQDDNTQYEPDDFYRKLVGEKPVGRYDSSESLKGVKMKLARTVINLCNESLDDELKKAHPYLSGAKVKSGPHTKEDATKEAKELREKGTHATIWHLSGPKSGPKSKYVVTVGDGKH